MVGEIEKAIQAANIGVNPNNNGESVQLFFPPMTVEQRAESAKGAKAMTENAKVSIRNIRKNSNDKIKKLSKDKEITDDEAKKAEAEVQKITDTFVAKSDETFKAKEAEIMKV
jgi:ribosome recycling factor